MGKVILPKIGHIKVKQHRPMEGKVETCTIKREGDCWYVVFACEIEAQKKLPYTDLAVGIDMGLKHFMRKPARYVALVGRSVSTKTSV